MPSTLVRLSNQGQAEAGSCVSQWFLLCDVILRALLCLGGGGACIDMGWGQKKMKEFKEWQVKKREEGRGGR